MIFQQIRVGGKLPQILVQPFKVRLIFQVMYSPTLDQFSTITGSNATFTASTMAFNEFRIQITDASQINEPLTYSLKASFDTDKFEGLHNLAIMQTGSVVAPVRLSIFSEIIQTIKAELTIANATGSYIY